MNRFVSLFVLIVIFSVTTHAEAYDEKIAHPFINAAITEESQVFSAALERLGLSTNASVNGKEIKDWFREGGTKEDAAPRWLNHFHDPTKPWNVAGLMGERVSSALWAQQEFQDAFNTWSWPQARTYYLEGVTATEPALREKSLAKSFRALGQVLHLLADAAVPAHTRNDLHPFGEPYELYCKNNMNNIPLTAPSIGTTITTRSLVPGLTPISNFWDTAPAAGENPNPEGLAEYTNRNFLSTDTVFKGYPYPALADSDALPLWLEESTYNGSPDYRLYLSGSTTDGKTINHLADTGYFWSELIKADPKATDDARYKLDDKCFQDYAAILVPKAVGYGTALLDYFFRGQIEITLPQQGIYALSQGAVGEGFSQIQLQARNTTPGGEEMPAGKVTLVAKYKVAQADPFQGVEVPVGQEFIYNVATASADTTIPRDKPVELLFTLPTPIPLWATDLTLQLVYSGRLGIVTAEGFAGEEDAVAVGVMNASEPTPFDYINGMDLICLNDEVVATGSAAVMTALDLYGNPIFWNTDVFPDSLEDLYLKFSAADRPVWASPNNFDISLPELLPGSFARVYYIANPLGLSTKISHQVMPVPTDARDNRLHKLNNYIFAVRGLTNEEVVENGEVKRITPKMNNIRGMKVWSFLSWTKKGYPANTSCSSGASTIPLTGPVPLTPLVP
jgi:hypothetical protein